jgi:hypothetical protein
MSYIGRQNLGGAYRQLDDISSGFDGSDTTHTMQVNSQNVTVGDVNQIILSLGGVIQKPGTDFTVSGSVLTFTTAPAANTSFFAILLGSDNGGTVTPTDGSVTNDKISSALTTIAGLTSAGAAGTATSIAGIPFYKNDTGSVYTHDVSGTDSTAFGIDALDAITTGDNNTVVGSGAGGGLTTGHRNTLMGQGAGILLTEATHTVAIGNAAASGYDTETNNIAIGHVALGGSVAGGEYNVAIGNNTLDALTSADNNVAIGYNAGTAITTGGTNTLVGYEAGKDMTTQTGCTFIGEQSGRANTGSSNTALGRDTLYTNTNGQYNVAIGDGALTTMNDSGGTDEADFNVAIGYQACSNLTTGYKTNAIGYQAGNRGTTTNYNVLIGYQCYGPQTGNGGNNLIGGASGGSSMTTANYNNGLGAACFPNLTTGYSNIALGHDAGTGITEGYNNIHIGYKTNAGGGDRQYAILIGHGDGINTFSDGGANTIRMGKRTHYISNTFTSNATWSHSSDERYKKDIQDNTNCGLDFINELRPITYKWKAPSELDTDLPEYDKDKTEADYTKKNYGLIAQEVKAALDKFSITDFEGWRIDPEHAKDRQEVSEQMFVYPLIKAVQELSAKVKALEEA